MITFQRECLSHTINAMKALLAAHYAEAIERRKRPELNVDWDWYRSVESVGMLAIVAMRDGGAMVGYAAFMVGPHPHCRQHRVATNDVFYIKPDYRKGTHAAKLRRYCETMLRDEMNVDEIAISAERGSTLQRLLELADYKELERVFSKRLRK